MSDRDAEAIHRWNDHDHQWTLWTKMSDGTGRLSRWCQECDLLQTKMDTYEDDL